MKMDIRLGDQFCVPDGRIGIVNRIADGVAEIAYDGGSSTHISLKAETAKKNKRGFSSIGLVSPKDPDNIGSVIRAAGCYDASMIAIEGMRCQSSRLDTGKFYRHLPVIHGPDIMDLIPFKATPVVVDLVEGASSLVDFVHPESAFYIFGPEDGTIGKEILDKVPTKVMIPTKFCMNLAATVNVVLYDRLAKRSK